MKRLLLLFALALVAAPAAAQTQVVVAPSAVTFTLSDVDMTLTASFKLTFYPCGSVAGDGSCVSPSANAAPNPPTVAKMLVTSSGQTRRVSFTPLQSYLAALQPGPYVVKVSAVGDPIAGGTGASAESIASGPFFPVGRIPGVPTSVAIQP